MSTEISWQPGSSTIKIEGKIDMEVNMQWATAQVENDWVMDNLWAYSMSVYPMSCSCFLFLIVVQDQLDRRLVYDSDFRH
jgi:hypothetical protein